MSLGFYISRTNLDIEIPHSWFWRVVDNFSFEHKLNERNLFTALHPTSFTDKTHRCLHLAPTLCFSGSWCTPFSESRSQLQNTFFSHLTTTHILDEPGAEPLEKSDSSSFTWLRVDRPPPHTPCHGCCCNPLASFILFIFSLPEIFFLFIFYFLLCSGSHNIVDH